MFGLPVIATVCGFRSATQQMRDPTFTGTHAVHARIWLGVHRPVLGLWSGNGEVMLHDWVRPNREGRVWGRGAAHWPTVAATTSEVVAGAPLNALANANTTTAHDIHAGEHAECQRDCDRTARAIQQVARHSPESRQPEDQRRQHCAGHCG